MRRGFLAGLVSGTAVSGVVLGAVSLLTEVPGARAPEAVSLDVPAGSEFDQSREDTQTSLPALQATPDPDEVPQVEAPEPDDLSALSGADTEAGAMPQAGEAQGSLTAPEAQQDGAGVALGTEEPVLPNPQAMAPEAPEGESDLSISTEPAQPPQPEPADDETAFPTETQPDDGAMEEPAEDAAQDDSAEATADSTDDMQSQVAEPAEEQPQESPETQAATAETEAEPEASSTIGDLAQGVTTNRLPSVGDEAQEAAAVADPVEAETEEAAAEEDTRPPLERYATAFENPEGKPLMAIVLLDDGSSPIGAEALADFPYPISFAVDAGSASAAAAADKYRAAGREVLAMVDLPETATARDAEVAMATYLSAVPEAVAVIEGTESGLQSSREAAEQLIPILRDSGHGLVMFPKGLNTTQKLIAREGVPSATVFRDFDAKGQDANVIRRFLDQAAFRAAQEESGVIMVGRLRPDTISALLLWGLQDRASSVALAPVSAVLRGE